MRSQLKGRMRKRALRSLYGLQIQGSVDGKILNMEIVLKSDGTVELLTCLYVEG